MLQEKVSNEMPKIFFSLSLFITECLLLKKILILSVSVFIRYICFLLFDSRASSYLFCIFLLDDHFVRLYISYGAHILNLNVFWNLRAFCFFFSSCANLN